MFVQVMEGRVGNREGLHAQFAAWMSDLQPGADAERRMSLIQVDRNIDLPAPTLYSR